MASDNPSPKFSTAPVAPDAEGPIYKGADYVPVLSNWFTAKPYGFRYTPKSGNDAMVMYLPIGPSNLTISTSFATNLVPTLYGTVEEHSPVRYYDIVIEGTTGMVPKYVKPEKPGVATPQVGRTAFAIKQSLSLKAGGFFAKTLATVENVLTTAGRVFDKITGGGSAVTGVQLDQTGYYAFHNFYRFLLKYKKNASGVDESKGQARSTSLAPLVFFNYKDNNEYSVVIRNFTLKRDRNDPMLYNFSITMRGYDLAPAGNAKEIDKNKSVDELQEALGLKGIDGSSFLGDAKGIAADAKGVLSSVANGVSQLGR